MDSIKLSDFLSLDCVDTDFLKKENNLPQGVSYYIYGTRKNGIECATFLRRIGIEIKGFLDENVTDPVSIYGESFNVDRVENLTGTCNYVIISTSKKYEAEIERTLITQYYDRIEDLIMFSEIKNRILRKFFISVYKTGENDKLEKIGNCYRDFLSRQIYFCGRYSTWETALLECGGYDEKTILDAVVEATRRVMNNEAIYERDGVCFYNPKWNYQILGAILYSSTKLGKNNPVLLDVGGALGSTLLQHDFLDGIRWNIVEQKSYVEVGRKITPQICFWYSIEEFNDSGERADIVLLSSVLMYLKNPYEYIEKVLSIKPSYIIIDRTYFSSKNSDVIVKQFVPDSVCGGSYPAHLLSEKKIMDIILDDYALKVNWNSTLEHEEREKIKYVDGFAEEFIYSRGALFERK